MACVVENADTRFESPSVPYFQDAGHDSSGLPITGLADRQFAVALLVRRVRKRSRSTMRWHWKGDRWAEKVAGPNMREHVAVTGAEETSR